VIKVSDQSDIERIVRLVNKYLEPHQPADFRLEVQTKGIQKEEDWYYVLVEPNREDARSYEYYGRLAEAEMDLQEHENVKVLLVPTLPSGN